MQECGMVLCLHAEDPSTFCIDREDAYIRILRQIAHDFPRLRIVVEHVTSRHMVDAVCELPDTVAATITVHHLLLTLDDVLGDKLAPHNFCKPIAKRPEDRDRLVWAAKYGGPKFFFGSDSAPHPRGQKECASGCAGIFTAPVALELLTKWFLHQGEIEQLEPFVSENGARFYDLPLNEGEIILIREPWQVPAMIGDIIPFLASEKMEWCVVT
jgi:dihydroorotase